MLFRSYSLANYLALYIYPYDQKKMGNIYNAALTGHPAPVTILRTFKFSPGYKDEPEQKWVQVSARSIDYKDNHAVLLNMVDVTETKTLEQIIISREKMASLGHVSVGIAHEIRNPLMGISLTLDNICGCLDQAQELELSDMLDQALDAVQTIAKVVERVLDFSRPSQLQLRSMDVRAMVSKAIRMVAFVAKKNHAEISTVWPDKLPVVMADPQFMIELLVNLLSNSIQAMSQQTNKRSIIINVYANHNYLSIKIIDSGPGIPIKDIDKIFEPFYTTKGDGSGLGLSICRRIITDHGGTIELTYSHLSGAGFLITMPVGLESENANEQTCVVFN